MNTITRFMGQFNPHRFLQLNFLKLDIVKKLKRFSRTLSLPTSATQTNSDFHESMKGLFQQMNDKHTKYSCPLPMEKAFALLGFFVKTFYDPSDTSDGGRRFVVASSLEFFDKNTLPHGSEILTWNNVPIQKVISQLAQDGFGSNRHAQIDSAVEDLTSRHLGSLPIPNEPFVSIRFRSPEGDEGFAFVPWVYVEINDDDLLESLVRVRNPLVSYKSHTSNRAGIVNEALRSTYKVPAELVQGLPLNSVRALVDGAGKIDVEKQYQELFNAKIRRTKTGLIGHLIISSFNSDASPGVVKELSRVLRLMPKRGVVVDVRGNNGGNAGFAKALAELLTDEEIFDRPTSVRATRLTDMLFSNITEEEAISRGISLDVVSLLSTYGGAVQSALQIGEPFTGPTGSLYRISEPGRPPSRKLKRVYSGSVITLTDGRVFSAGDVYASIQKDQNLSLIVGTSGNIGAGGATSVMYSRINVLSPNLRPFPGGVDFSVAFARIYRTGNKSGVLLEHFGVEPHIRYYPTYNDALRDDQDLFQYLGRLLSDMS